MRKNNWQKELRQFLGNCCDLFFSVDCTKMFRISVEMKISITPIEKKALKIQLRYMIVRLNINISRIMPKLQRKRSGSQCRIAPVIVVFLTAQ
jgi:hypothetical protein